MNIRNAKADHILLRLNRRISYRHNGTFIYNSVFKSFDCIYSLASAHPKGLIELKAQMAHYIYTI